LPARRGWQRWVPYAAIGWSLLYAVLGGYWAVGEDGFPYPSGTVSNLLGPLLGRLGQAVAWTVMMLSGLPAAVLGLSMLRSVQGRLLRPLLIAAGALLTGSLLLLMTSPDLLVKVGYLPAALLGHLTAEQSQGYLDAWRQWATIDQLLCMLGGFLWLGATVCYARRSAGACVYCGRRDEP
jgi:hypothetical protein